MISFLNFFVIFFTDRENNLIFQFNHKEKIFIKEPFFYFSNFQLRNEFFPSHLTLFAILIFLSAILDLFLPCQLHLFNNIIQMFIIIIIPILLPCLPLTIIRLLALLPPFHQRHFIENLWFYMDYWTLKSLLHKTRLISHLKIQFLAFNLNHPSSCIALFAINLYQASFPQFDELMA